VGGIAAFQLLFFTLEPVARGKPASHSQLVFTLPPDGLDLRASFLGFRAKCGDDKVGGPVDQGESALDCKLSFALASNICFKLKLSMANPGDFAYTVKQHADIVRIIGEYVKLKKAGAQNFSGLCPFHKEKTPSFSVHATRQFYHCFGCGVSGDVFSFIQKIENITFPEAVRSVAQKLGIAIPRQASATAAEAKEAQLRSALIEMHEQACVFFQEQLHKPEATAAREYLASRGLRQTPVFCCATA